MHRGMSYRKPPPKYIPSPPPSPTSSFANSQNVEFPPPLTENSSDTLAPTLNSAPPPQEDLPGAPPQPPRLPSVPPPVYFGTMLQLPQHLIYRPPTPPRRTLSSVFDRNSVVPVTFEVSLQQRPKDAELLKRRQDGAEVSSLATEQLHSRSSSSMSFSLTDWYLAQIPTSANRAWWDKIKMLGIAITNKMRGLRNCSAFC